MKLLAVDPRGSLCHGLGCVFTVTVVRLTACSANNAPATTNGATVATDFCERLRFGCYDAK